MAAEGDRVRARARVQVMALMHECRHAEDWKCKQESLQRALDLVLQEVPEQLTKLLQLLLEELHGGGWERRSYLAKVMELVGCRFFNEVPVMVTIMLPTLVLLLRDHVPEVVMEAMVAAQKLLKRGFRELVVQEREAGKVDDSLVEVWRRMVGVKELVAPMLGASHDVRVRSRAVKYFEHQALLFSPDPERSGKEEECSVAWIEGRVHPVLVVSELGQEAANSVDLLLTMLREPAASKLTSTLVLVLFNSLESIARRRPSLLKTILPGLMDFAPRCEGLKEVLGRECLMANVMRCLWINLNRLLKYCQICAPDLHKRLVPLVREMQSEFMPRLSRGQRVENERGGMDRRARLQASSSSANPEPELDPGYLDGVRKRAFTQENGGARVEGAVDRAKRSKLSAGEQELDSATKVQQVVRSDAQDGRIPQQESMEVQQELVETQQKQVESQQEQVEAQQEHMLPPEQSQLQQLIGMIAAMLAGGEQGAQSCRILVDSLTTDMLVDVCIANFVHLPAVRPPEDIFSANLAQLPGVGPSEESDSEPSSADHTSGPADVLPAVPVVEPQRTAPEEEIFVLDVVPAPTSAGSTAQALLPQALSADQTASSPVTRSEEVNSVRDPRAATAIATEATTVSVTRDTTPSNGTQPAADLPRARFVPMRLGRESPSGSEIKEKGSDSESHLSPAALPPYSTWQATAAAATAIPPDPRGVEADTGSQQAESTVENGPEHERVPNSGITPSGDVTTDEPQDLCKASVERIRQSYMATSGDGGLQAGLISLLEGNASAPVFKDYYSRHDGHALAMDVLARICNSSGDRAAYEFFFGRLCHRILHAFPPDSMLLAKLVFEAPQVPASTLSLLNSLRQSEGRIGQLLFIIGLLFRRDRPDEFRMRKQCLEFVLHCAIHGFSSLRCGAIELVVKELHSLPWFSGRIETFAIAVLDQSKLVQGNNVKTVALYMELCRQKAELLAALFPIYGSPSASSTFRHAVKSQITEVVRVIRRSPSVSVLKQIINKYRHASGCQHLIKLMDDPEANTGTMVVRGKEVTRKSRGGDGGQGREKRGDKGQGKERYKGEKENGDERGGNEEKGKSCRVSERKGKGAKG